MIGLTSRLNSILLLVCLRGDFFVGVAQRPAAKIATHPRGGHAAQEYRCAHGCFLRRVKFIL